MPPPDSPRPTEGRRLARRRHRRVRPSLVAAVAFLLALMASAVAGLLGHGMFEARRQERADAAFDRVAFEIDERLQRVKDHLRSTADQTDDPAALDAGTVGEQGHFDRRDFGTELLSIGLVQATPVDAFNEAVTTVRSNGLDNYRVIDPVDVGENRLVTFEGSAGKAVIRGLDLSSVDGGTELLDRAERSTRVEHGPVLSDLPFATAPSRQDESSSFLMAVGLDQPGTSESVPVIEGTPRQFWLIGVVSTTRLLDEVRPLIDDSHQLALIDGDRVLASTSSATIRVIGDLDDRPSSTGPAGPWQVAVVDTASSALEPFIVVASGAAMSVVVAALAWTLAWSREGALGIAADEEASRGRSQRKFEALVGNLTDLIVVFSDDWKLTYVSPSVGAVMDRRPQDLVGRHGSTLFCHPELGMAAIDVATSGEPFEACLNAADGERFYEGTITDLLHDPAVAGRVWTGHDITERKIAEARLEFDATHDHLTGLPNRILLMDRLERARQRARRDNTLIALIFLDIDRFKIINDSLGHTSGDQLLIEVADRLVGAARGVDTVARFGGDEFIVVCERVIDHVEAERIAERLLAALEPPVRIGDHETVIGASLGIVVAPADVEPDVLIRNADTAMYEAKANDRGRYQLFAESLRSDVVHRLDIDASLRKAIERQELELHYQPIVDLTTRETVGLEALVRWRHPQRGLLLPEGFLAIAEDAGLLDDIGHWVFEEAGRHASLWHAARDERRPFFLSLNVTTRQLRHPSALPDIDRLTQALSGTTWLTVDGVRIEATRTAEPIDLLVEVADHSAFEMSETEDVISGVRNAGAHLVADDFGNGPSKLGQLRSGRFSGFKIDQSYIANLTGSDIDRAIVRTLIALGNELRLDVYAKGIETEAQRELLVALGCHYGQGHLFGPAVPAELTARHLVSAGQTV